MDTGVRMQTEDTLFERIDNLRREVRALIQQEAQLAKTEMSDKLSRFGRNGILMAAGGLILYTAVLCLLLSLGFLMAFGFKALGLSTGMALFLGFLVLALILGGLGSVLAAKALSGFSGQSLAPEKTLETLGEIKAGSLQHAPVPRAPAQHDEHLSSGELKSEVEASQRRIRQDWNAIRDRMSVSYVTSNMLCQVKNHPVRSVGIGLGTGLAGFVFMRGRLFGRKHRT